MGEQSKTKAGVSLGEVQRYCAEQVVLGQEREVLLPLMLEVRGRGGRNRPRQQVGVKEEQEEEEARKLAGAATPWTRLRR